MKIKLGKTLYRCKDLAAAPAYVSTGVNQEGEEYVTVAFRLLKDDSFVLLKLNPVEAANLSAGVSLQSRRLLRRSE